MKLSNKVYDVIKTICLILVPALVAMIVAIGPAVGMSDETVKAVSGAITAIAAAVGGILGFSSAEYYKNEDKEPEHEPEPEPDPIATVYLSPSGQSGNLYAVGNTNEREQCELISAYCRDALEAHGFKVLLEPGAEYNDRVAHAKAAGADVYIPIHTNAFDGKVSGTRMFVRSFKDFPDYEICKKVFARLDACCPGTSSNIKEYPELWEFRNTTPIPGIYCECDFHDNPDVARFIIEHQKDIGESIARGLCDYYGVEW